MNREADFSLEKMRIKTMASVDRSHLILHSISLPALRDDCRVTVVCLVWNFLQHTVSRNRSSMRLSAQRANCRPRAGPSSSKNLRHGVQLPLFSPGKTPIREKRYHAPRMFWGDSGVTAWPTLLLRLHSAVLNHLSRHRLRLVHFCHYLRVRQSSNLRQAFCLRIPLVRRKHC